MESSRGRCHLHLSSWEIWRRHGDRHHADASDGHHRRDFTAESLLCTSGAVSTRASRTATIARYGPRRLTCKGRSSIVRKKSSAFGAAFNDLVSVLALPAMWWGAEHGRTESAVRYFRCGADGRLWLRSRGMCL